MSVSISGRTRELARSLSTPDTALAVGFYGSDRVHMLATFDAQRICREGFQWLDKKASDRHRNGFLHLPEEDQLAVVRQMSDDAITPELSDPGHELFQLLKGEIIRAFYTSPAGLAELDLKGNGYYNQSPG